MSRTTGKPLGRRRSSDRLTTDQIAAGALKMLIEDGMENFSVRRLAKRLGVGTATIYWHMDSRNDLLVAALSYALQDFSPPQPSDDWQWWFRELFNRFRELLQDNRGVAKIFGLRLVANAGIDRHIIESVLVMLTRAGFDDSNITEAFNTVWVAMVGFVTMELTPEPDTSPEWEETMRERVNTVNVDAHPLTARHLARLSNKAFAMRWDNGSTTPMDASFQAYVNVVLKGLEAVLREPA